MAEALALDGRFISKYNQATMDVNDTLKNKVNKTILQTMKNYLDSKDIEYANSYTLEEFEALNMKKFDKETQMQLTSIKTTMDIELASLIKNLKDGSQTAISKFTENIAFPIGETMLKTFAVKTAFALNPGVGAVAMGGLTFAPTIAKGIKKVVDENKEAQNTAMDVALIKLTTVKKEDGTASYKINEDEKKAIINIATDKGINLDGNLEDAQFIQQLVEFDYDTKKQVVNLLNNLKGNPYDIKAIVDETKISLKKFQEIIGDNIVSPLSTAALYGIALSGTATEIAGDEFAALISGLTAGGATGNIFAGLGISAGQYALSKYGNLIPFVGGAIEEATQQANAVITTAGVTGATLGVALAGRVIPSLIIKGGKAIVNKLNTSKEAKEGKKALYEETFQKIDKAVSDTNTEMESRTKGSAAMDIVKDYCKELGINVPSNVITPSAFKEFTKRLSKEDKKKIFSIANTLQSVKESHEGAFKKVAKNIGKAAYWGGILALAGLGAYDAFLNPGFIEGIRDRQTFAKKVKGENSEQTAVNSSSQKNIENVKSEDNTKAVDEEINRLALQKKEEELKKAQEAVSEKVNEFRVQLPEKEGDQNIQFLHESIKPKHEESFFKSPGKWFNERVDNVKNSLNDNSIEVYSQNNKFIETLGVTTPEGLESYLSEIDPNNPELMSLMEHYGAQNVHELANNPEFQVTVNLAGKGNWFNNLKPATEWKEPTYYNPGLTYYKGDKETADIFIRMVNEDITNDLSDIPLQSASDEEIIKYLSEANTKELKALSIYTGTRGENMTGMEQLGELFDDVQEREALQEAYESQLDKMTYNTKEVEEAVKDLKGMQQEYAEATEKIGEIQATKEGYMQGINNKTIPADSFKIAGAGAVVGATIGTANEIRKGIFKKIAERVKGFFNRKKALPPPQSSDKVKETENTTKKSWKEKLKFIKGKETQEPKEKSPETIQASKEQDNETEKPDREDDV